MTAQVASDTRNPVASLKKQLGNTVFDLVCIFASPRCDFRTLARQASGQFGDADVLACTTAGEIGNLGYQDGQIIAVGFPRRWFKSATYVIPRLDNLNSKALMDAMIQSRFLMMQAAPSFQHEFALTLIDGLSLQEERLTAHLSSGLGPMPLFGGSSGDGTAFRQTLLARNGETYENAALIALVRSACAVKVFSIDHFMPSDTRMVVTRADPAQRIVYEINAEPAADEYARLLGRDASQLNSSVFAAHPVLVRLADTHHARSIQQVRPNGALQFFSAIDEGMVLSLAEHDDIIRNLDDGLTNLAAPVAPERIIGCDCLFRRIAAEETQQGRAMSQMLTKHRVVGFSTYGEQIGSLHVNQTFTGVAIYPPSSSKG
ncbi:FIST N-terminal domain-containing protein [Pseudoprimorskyibacter insulae]|nr:FIST N-terminal domain-containing protein [Pseudoprimorskyibacter insulae]